jgi:hypothetical protein
MIAGQRSPLAPQAKRAKAGDPQRIGNGRIAHDIGWSWLRCNEIVLRSLKILARQQPDRHKTNAERDDQREQDE